MEPFQVEEAELTLEMAVRIIKFLMEGDIVQPIFINSDYDCPRILHIVNHRLGPNNSELDIYLADED